MSKPEKNPKTELLKIQLKREIIKLLLDPKFKDMTPEIELEVYTELFQDQLTRVQGKAQ